MFETFDSLYNGFILDIMNFACIDYENSQQYREARQMHDSAQQKLLHMLPPKKRKKAMGYLEDLGNSYTLELNFLYAAGVRDGVHLLRHMGGI